MVARPRSPKSDSLAVEGGPFASSSSDEELLGSFLAGNDDAFSLLVRRHEDKIFGLALKMTSNRADALDATQETFLTAFRRAGSFRGDSAFGSWLYRIGINTCNDLLRKRSRREVLDPEVGGTAASQQVAGGAGIEADAGLRLDLVRALARLPSSFREAVVMHDLGGIPYNEIATLTGVGLGTVKSRISRGRRELAAILEQPGPDPASKDQ